MCRVGAYGNSVLSTFAMNLKLLSKTTKFFKIMDYFYN